MRGMWFVTVINNYVHEDSGYGENDGYNFIEFYCSSIEAISLEEF